MIHLDDIPDGLPTTPAAQLSWLRRMSKFLVADVFNSANQDDVKVVMESMKTEVGAEYVYPYCYCREGMNNTLGSFIYTLLFIFQQSQLYPLTN